jgi:hypothetical protein
VLVSRNIEASFSGGRASSKRDETVGGGLRLGNKSF